MTSQTPDRRRVARLTVPWHIGEAGLELRRGHLLDLSSMGARIEHADPVYEGLVCDVVLPPALGQGRLTGRVVWTRLHKRAQTFEGVTRVFYQTGLVFVEITPEQREALAAALTRLQAGESSDGPVSRPADSPQHPGGWHTDRQGGVSTTMTAEGPDLRILAARLEAIVDRLEKLEVQVRALVTSQTVEAKEFVVRDERREIRARLEMQEYAPCLTFYDRLGKERLTVGLRTDGSPFFFVEGREISLDR